ncbi:MAG: O-antigen ligase family protein [Phycisphaerae bacterium]|nr:O-antigen ligase family protein [Phycisphaerae bacterium]
MSLWSFRFVLWYICILMVQPQNRFPFLWPFHIADICVMAAVVLHGLSALSEKRPLIRFGPGTILAILLLVFGMLSQYVGPLQTTTAWNAWIDSLVKSAIILILVEATATTVERAWAVQATMVLASLWWIKAGIRLSGAAAFHAGERLMGPAVSIVQGPNEFAYMMCAFIPAYLFFYQQSVQPYLRWGFLALALAAVFIALKTGSRTGMLQLVVLGLLLAPRYGARRKRALLLAALALFLLFPLVGSRNVQRFKTIPASIKAFLTGEKIVARPFDEISQDEQSAQERALKNHDTWALIKDYPLFGVGVNADEGLMGLKYPMAEGQVHCEILMAGRQMGMIGMGLYIGFLAVIVGVGRRLQKSMAGRWPAVSDWGWMLKLQGIVFIVGGSFASIPWHPIQLISAGMASALWVNLRDEAVAEQSRAGAVAEPLHTPA